MINVLCNQLLPAIRQKVGLKGLGISVEEVKYKVDTKLKKEAIKDLTYGIITTLVSSMLLIFTSITNLADTISYIMLGYTTVMGLGLIGLSIYEFHLAKLSYKMFLETSDLEKRKREAEIQLQEALKEAEELSALSENGETYYEMP